MFRHNLLRHAHWVEWDPSVVQVCLGHGSLW